MDTIIIDDDKMSINHLKLYCQKIPSLNLIQSFIDPKMALLFLEKKPVDLLLLDVEMPSISGIELLSQIPIRPEVIFTTSKTNYAFDAFQYGAVDYLQKPFNFLRFEKAIDKVLQRRETTTLTKEKDKNSLYIKEKGKLVRLDVNDILYFENVRDYVCVKTNNQTYTIISTLKDIVKKLPERVFLKVHRSYIVNINKIVDIDNTSLVISNKVIPISRVNRPILMNKIQSI